MTGAEVTHAREDNYWARWREIDPDQVLVVSGGRIKREDLAGKQYYLTPEDIITDGGPSAERGEFELTFVHQAPRDHDSFPDIEWYEVGYYLDGPPGEEMWSPMVISFDEEWIYSVGRGDVIVTADGRAFVTEE